MSLFFLGVLVDRLRVPESVVDDVVEGVVWVVIWLNWNADEKERRAEMNKIVTRWSEVDPGFIVIELFVRRIGFFGADSQGYYCYRYVSVFDSLSLKFV